MITEKEVKDLAISQGVPLPYVEKDYVMGWLLWGIYRLPALQSNLILKGGNCLRKVYFPDTRFSDDLDFTAKHLDAENVFLANLNSVCQEVEDTSGIKFDLSQTRIESVAIPDKECKALDGRVYFKGFAGDASVTMRIKFDISQYEKIVLPLQNHPIIHNYSDANQCQTSILSYSIEEILAEKLRSWIQRTRPRDLFDVAKIIQSNKIPINKINILSTFLQKTIFKNIPMAGCDEMLYEKKFLEIEQNWGKTIICPATAIIVASNAIAFFKDFIRALFHTDVLHAIGAGASYPTGQSYNVRLGLREPIISAGKERHLIRLRYDNKERDVEPYSFRYKVTREGYGAEYFFGFDRTRDQTIKSFLLNKIQGVSILPQKFIPRWLVEF